MAVLQMQRISICALKKNRKAILEKLQSMGVMEINQILGEDDAFHTMDTTNARSNFEKAAASVDRALEVLQIYAPEKKSLFASLAGKELVDQGRYRQVIRDKESLARIANQIQSLDRERSEEKSEILKLENSIESLTPWLPLEVPMDFKGTEHTEMFLGILPGEWNMEQIYTVTAEKAPDAQGFEVHIVSAGQEGTFLSVFCLKEEARQLEEALRSRGFARPSQMVSQVPDQAKAGMEAEIAGHGERITEIEKELEGFGGRRQELRLLADYYRVRAEKYEVLGTLPQSERTFFLSGYVPVKYAGRLQTALEKTYDCVVDVEELKEDEEAPVLLHNNSFSESAEGILESYGLPAKGEVDPTTIMSVFYVFLFGLMLSDAAYGIIVSLACGVALKKFPRMGDGMRKSLKLFFWCGLSTLFWGIMFGGFFGDLVDVVSRTFFGQQVSLPALWFIPLNDPMKLLVYSMLFGLIHLFTGLGIKGYMCIKEKKYMDFFCDVVLWFLFLIGLIVLFLPTDIFASVAQTKIVFPAVVNLLGKASAIVGAVGILLMSGRENKNFGLRIALGAYDLYNVTGWLSDVLSYSRLLALGLATGVIAQVVNQMGSMAGNSIFGIILFIVVFIVGHTLNLAINLLGAYVHTNRLQYVEFFGKFYEGGGRAFNPFKENTKYADIKED